MEAACQDTRIYFSSNKLTLRGIFFYYYYLQESNVKSEACGKECRAQPLGYVNKVL